MEKTCDSLLLEDLKQNGSTRLGMLSGVEPEFFEDLAGKAKKMLTGGENLGLACVILILDKRENKLMAVINFYKGEGFGVAYGKPIRRGRIDALNKILSTKSSSIHKMPPLEPWPKTLQKEFFISMYSFPRDCESCIEKKSSKKAKQKARRTSPKEEKPKMRSSEVPKQVLWEQDCAQGRAYFVSKDYRR